MAPPRTLIWVTAIAAVEALTCSMIVSAAARSMSSTKRVAHGEHPWWRPLLFFLVDARIAPWLDHVEQGSGQFSEGRDDGLAGLGVARIDEQAEENHLTVQLLGEEWHRRRLHHVGDRGELFGSRGGQFDEPGNGVRRGGKDQHPADDLIHLVEPELEPGRHAEVSTAATNRPEEIGMVLRVDTKDLPVGCYQLGGEE